MVFTFIDKQIKRKQQQQWLYDIWTQWTYHKIAYQCNTKCGFNHQYRQKQQQQQQRRKPDTEDEKGFFAPNRILCVHVIESRSNEQHRTEKKKKPLKSDFHR